MRVDKKRTAVVLAMLLVFVLMTGCAGQKKTEKQVGTTTVDAETEHSEPVITDARIDDETLIENVERQVQTLDQMISELDAKICIVLGPGMARGMAHVGVLEAFVEQKVPLHCVVGTEMGAVIGGLYSSHQNINKLQWQIFKLKQDIYLDFPFFSINSRRSTGEKLNRYLQNNLAGVKIESMSPAFNAVAVDRERWQKKVFTQGAVTDAISASVAIPGIFEAWKTGSDKYYLSGVLVSPMASEVARQLGGNIILGVNLLADNFAVEADNDRYSNINRHFAIARNFSDLQRSGFDMVIEPDLSRYDFIDFEKRSELIALGKDEGKVALEKLRDLLVARLQKRMSAGNNGEMKEE